MATGPEPRVVTFTPSADQWRLHHALRRFNVFVCHRGFGKTYLGAHELVRVAVQNANVRLAYITDLRVNAEDKCWRPILEPLLTELQHVKIDRADMRGDFPNGSSITCYGTAEDQDRIRGLHLDGVVIDEFAKIPPSAWELRILPALLRRNGGAMFLGTPSGRNHFYALYYVTDKDGTKHTREEVDPEWRCLTIRVSESSVFTPEQLATVRKNMTPEQYAQEYECSWDTPMQGAVYGRELNAARQTGRIRAFAHDPALTVETWWDLGHTDATAVIFTQTIDREIRIIDYLEDERKDLAYYAKILQDKDYDYSRDHLPHDAGAHRLEAPGGKSIEDQWRALRPRSIGITVHPRQDAMAGIHLARLVFPRVWFASPGPVDRLLEALESYHYEWDRKRNIAKPEPDHDWSSHAADAFRLMATHIRKREEHADNTQRYAETKWDKYGGYDKVSAQARARGSLS